MDGRDPERIDRVIEQLRAIWKAAPELRLGQMLLNNFPEPVLYYVEDEALIERLKRRLLENK
jgi:uncharacterized protein YihD (DUF1040 family)